MQAVGGAAGLHRTYIGLVENGKRSLTIAAAARIARALGVSLSQVIVDAERELDRPLP